MIRHRLVQVTLPKALHGNRRERIFGVFLGLLRSWTPLTIGCRRAKQSKIKSHNPAGRPFGKVERKPIDLPDGDRLVPCYTTFAKKTDINPKYSQRNRHGFPLVTHAGIVYVRERAGLQVLAEPKK